MRNINIIVFNLLDSLKNSERREVKQCIRNFIKVRSEKDIHMDIRVKERQIKISFIRASVNQEEAILIGRELTRVFNVKINKASFKKNRKYEYVNDNDLTIENGYFDSKSQLTASKIASELEETFSHKEYKKNKAKTNFKNKINSKEYNEKILQEFVDFFSDF